MRRAVREKKQLQGPVDLSSIARFSAPYRHFRDRDELLVDVARRGFDQFEVKLARAWDGGRPDAFTAFERVGKAYLRFAKSELTRRLLRSFSRSEPRRLQKSIG